MKLTKIESIWGQDKASFVFAKLLQTQSALITHKLINTLNLRFLLHLKAIGPPKSVFLYSKKFENKNSFDHISESFFSNKSEGCWHLSSWAKSAHSRVSDFVSTISSKASPKNFNRSLHALPLKKLVKSLVLLFSELNFPNRLNSPNHFSRHRWHPTQVIKERRVIRADICTTIGKSLAILKRAHLTIFR